MGGIIDAGQCCDFYSNNTHFTLGHTYSTAILTYTTPTQIQCMLHKRTPTLTCLSISGNTYLLQQNCNERAVVNYFSQIHTYSIVKHTLLTLHMHAPQTYMMQYNSSLHRHHWLAHRPVLKTLCKIIDINKPT